MLRTLRGFTGLVFAWLIAVSFPATLSAACPEFVVASGPAVGSAPFAIASADVNGDAIPDLVVPNFTSNSVSVLIGQGDGTFSTKVDYATGTSPIAVAAGDVNGDGNVDVVTANYNANTFSVLLNAGNGTFSASVHYPTGGAPRAVALAKLDAGSALDVVVAESAGTPSPPGPGHTISVSYGVGNGTFGARTTYTVDYGPGGVAVGDFNRDGRLDLAVSHRNAVNVAVLHANTGGTFNAATMVNVGDLTHGITAVDVDLDGAADLAATRSGNQVVVLRATGSGGFEAPVTYAVGSTPEGIVAGDFNGDSDADLLAVNYGTGSASLLLGKFYSQFETARTISLVGGARAPTAGDFNRDGRLDFATVTSDSNNTSIVLGSSSCVPSCDTFALRPATYAATSPVAVATGDFDRNGWMDVVIGSSSSSQITIRSFSAAGTFSSTFDVGRTQDDVAVGDINGDGWPDIVFVNYLSHTLVVKLNNGTGGFVAGVEEYTSGLNYPTDVTTADFGGDGRDEVAVTNEQGANKVVLFLASGPIPPSTGHLGYPQNLPAGTTPLAIVAGDINGDAKPDMAVANKGSNDVTVLINDGAGSFFTHYSSPVAGSEPEDVWLTDLDRNGILEIVTTYKSASSISIHSWTPSDVFGSRTDVAAGGVPVALTSGDYNVDGRPDIAAAIAGANKIALLRGNGTQTPNAAQLVTSTGGPRAIVTGDFDHDGRAEALAASPTDNVVRSVESLCATTTTVETSLHNARYTTDSVTFTVTVASLIAADDGTAELHYDSAGGPLIGDLTVTNGVGTYTTSSIPIGNHTIFAVFNALEDLASSSGSVAQVIRLGEPAGLVATPVTRRVDVELRWSQVPGATSYRVYRRSAAVPSPALIASPTAINFTDTVVSMGATYVYYVSAVGSSSESAYGPHAAATLVDFTDLALSEVPTTIKAVHMTELRSAVNAFRAAASQTAFSFSETAAPIVKAIHLQDLRTALAQAYSALGFASPSYTDPTITPFVTTVKAAHLEQLRSAVQSASGGLLSPD